MFFFNTIRDSTLFFWKFGACFSRLPRTCRHKLSASFAVVDDNEATILQTGSDSLSLESSVAFLLRLVFAVCISFSCLERKGWSCSLLGFKTSCCLNMPIGLLCILSLYIGSERVAFRYLQVSMFSYYTIDLFCLSPSQTPKMVSAGILRFSLCGSYLCWIADPVDDFC